MTTISTIVNLDERTLEPLSSPELAQLAMVSVRMLADRFMAQEKFFVAKEMLALLVQLQQRSCPGYESTIVELTPREPERPHRQ